MRRPASRLVPLVLTVASAPHALWAQDRAGASLGFAEEFALAADRGKVLEQLIPGSEDWYFYQCLHRQNEGRLAEIDPLLKAWIQRHGRTARVEEIENRQALLQSGRDPAGTFAFLQQRLGLRFDAQRQVAGRKPDLPTRLDPELIAPGTLARRALALHPGTMDGFTDAALPRLSAGDLDDDHLMSLLARLSLPDVPNLPALVVRNLKHPQSRGFGSLSIHKDLTLAQLEECVRLSPELLQNGTLIEGWLRRLQPGADVDVQRDARAREALLDALLAFTQRLSAAHNSLKGHVLYHRLVHDLQLGKPDRERFLAYLRLPRQGGWANPDRRPGRGEAEVKIEATFATGFEPIRGDEHLVRAYLQHFFLTEDGWQPYVEYVREDWLRPLFAETKILHGIGDMERWYSLLNDPAYYEALKERVEIAFPPTVRREFGAEEPVVIDVDLKNVPTLLVKVFRIDAWEWLRAQAKEVDAAIDLDGVLANEEKTHAGTDNPLRRVRKHFEFPQLARPGTYVVEFVGNGLASRVVIQKGRLQLAGRVGAAGHVVTILDEAGNAQRDATLWCGGREYAADERGEIAVPFAAHWERRNVVLRQGALATLARLDHEAEQYALTAGAFATRESLLGRRAAKVVVRPGLTVNGVPVSLSLLEEPELSIAAVDQDGVGATKTVRGLKLDATSELVQEITVPEGLAKLTVTLRGRVRNLSQGRNDDVSSPPVVVPVNGIAATARTHGPLLSRSEAGWVLDLLGKNGEPKADVAVALQLRHRDVRDAVDVTLETDARGRIVLGALDGITHVIATGFPEIGAWDLEQQDRTWPASLHAVAGETLRVPYLSPRGAAATGATRDVVALLEGRGGTWARDAFAHVAIANGFVELRDLPAGDYRLFLKEAGQHIEVRVADGAVRGGRAVSRERMLELGRRDLLHVTDVTATGTELTARLQNAGPSTRVHVFATRWLEPYDAFATLRARGDRDLAVTQVEHGDASYHAGRAIGDEYRYILERRYAAKFPGNMLRRPGLLLNPWALEEAPSTVEDWKTGGGKFGNRFGGKGKAGPVTGGPGGTAAAGMAASAFADLEFLPEPARLLANLRPDAQGLVRVALADLGPGHLVHVVAVDGESTVHRTLVLPDKPLAPRDRSLATPLDPGKHFTEQRRIEFVDGGGTAVIGDVATARTETYDTLASVFRLFQSLTGSADLDRFAFVLRWPQMSAAEKSAAYSKHACHELHVFLYHKDRAFFDAVVRPYLANKLHKTFLDEWLLGTDVARYLEPWQFDRLNVVERILLTQRIGAEAASGQRHVRELLELVSPDPEQAARWFDAALKSGALDAVAEALKPATSPAQGGADHRGLPAPTRQPEAAVADEKARDTRSKKLEAGEETKVDDLTIEGKEVFAGTAPDADKDRATDVERRRAHRALYRPPEATRAFVESNYWHRRIEEQTAELIRVNAFWRDFSDRKTGAPFVSPHVAEAARSFAEMMLALSVLDLPFAAGKHTVEQVPGEQVTGEQARNEQRLRAATPLLLVRKEILPAAAAPAGSSPVLLSQGVFRLDDRWRFEGNERVDNFVTGELLVDVPYGCQVVVTNPTSTPRKLDLLLQVPRGAVPVQKGFVTRGMPVQLGPFATVAVEYAFYFPAPVKATHYPAHVSRDGVLVAATQPVTLDVVATPSRVDTRSWEHVSQEGSAEEVLVFLDQANLGRVDLDRIAWRLRDRAFFGAVVGRLERRHAYHQGTWSYGILHQDVARSCEYLRHADAFVARCGRALDTPLLTIDPVERRTWQVVELEPLFHARAHRLGRRVDIQNATLSEQYGGLLATLACRRTLDDADWLLVTYHLLLQDRVAEALQGFARVDPARLPARIQYDYLRAYLDFFSAEHAVARGIAERYRDYPVERWRAMFRDVLDQLDEVEGSPVAVSDGDSRTQQQTAATAAEPALDLLVEARRVLLRHQNLARCEVRYYRLDAEVSFSTSPFVASSSGAPLCIEPARTDVVTIAAGQKETAFDLPTEFLGSNVLVEVRGAGLARRQPYLASSLAAQITESYGQLKVTHGASGKPLSRVYVKVYARMPDGAVRFHKDGYTDLRGRFDYASVSAPSTTGAERFAVLLLSETDGALIREVAPPGK